VGKQASKRWRGRPALFSPPERNIVTSNTCASGKRRYPSEARANKARRTINERGKGVKLRNVYRCDRCGGWHTTSNAPRA
jgi:hypothetical protein